MKNNKKIIPVASPDLTGNEKKYLNQALSSSWISSTGEFIDKFELEFAKYIGSKYAVSTSNGTAALHLALASMGLSESDEVIVPDLTFISTVNAVSYCRATPILVDIEKQGFGININNLESFISRKTKVIIPVHLYGIPANMEKIMEIAKKHNLLVLEDSAEAQGAEVKIGSIWKKVGGIGDAGIFSFYGNKIMTTGEGGMVVTNNKNLNDKMILLRAHGESHSGHYFHPQLGFNYRMTNMQAAIGLAQIERINKLLNIKKNISDLYREQLKNVQGITIPETNYQTRNVCWLFSIIVDIPYPLTRNQLISKLAKKGIDSRPFFIPIHKQPNYIQKGNFQNSAYASEHGLNLPSGYDLTNQEINYICESIKN